MLIIENVHQTVSSDSSDNKIDDKYINSVLKSISCLTKVSTAAPSSVGVVEINRKFARSRVLIIGKGVLDGTYICSK